MRRIRSIEGYLFYSYVFKLLNQVKENINVNTALEMEDVHKEDVEMDKNHDIDHSNTKEDSTARGRNIEITLPGEMEPDMENMTLNEYLMYEGRNVYLTRNCTSKKRGTCSKVAPVRSRNLVSLNSDEEDKEY
nr:hypothetical protein [Tanacetum cinerariifolium]